MNDIEKKIIGTWQLVHSVKTGTNGDTSYPFGEDALGFIIYDEYHNMAVQICRKNRATFSNLQFTAASTTELNNLPKDYLAYFGRYDIDTKNNVINHIINGHLFPNQVGTILARKYEFYGNKMSLKPVTDTSHEILWQKVSN
jgi:hypothetical protein